jgi:single-stranded DNA-binding protein
MTIPIQMSLHGFIAAAPLINFTSNGGARFYARIGVEHFHKESDGSFTKLEPTFHDLVAYAKTAERAYAKFKVGDNFVASGYINEYELDRNGQARAREEFVARRIGHDLARTRYQVDRTPSRQPEPPSADLPGGTEPAQVVGL